MAKYLIKRILLIIPTFIGITLITYLMIRLAPGDYTTLKAGLQGELKAGSIGSEILEQYGYTALTAGSGEGAIEVYRGKKDRIDLVVLDLGMPGMGGYRCLEELLKIEPALKVIIASGYSPDGQAKEKLESGAAGFVSKPYQLTELLKKVREVLDG